MISFNSIKKNLKKSFDKHKKIRASLLGDSATQLLAQAIRGYGYEKNLDIEIYEAEYNQVDQEIFDPDSKLYTYDPEYIIIFESTQKLYKKFSTTATEKKEAFADECISRIQSIISFISDNSKAKVIYCNFNEMNDNVFGNYSNKIAASFPFQLRKINYELMLLAEKNQRLFICDIASIQNYYGEEFMVDNKLHINADMALSLDALPVVAKNIVDIIQSICGQFKKCVILDLDNTMWGGVIGDDGMQKIQIGDLGIGKAFTNFQLWVKQLKERGIILAVCSKNTEHIAKEPFQSHPDMVLTLDDIAVFVANWENKADNIRYIQSVLNIGFDSMVFIDDNPFERNLVRQELPEVTVPEMPDDPADFLTYLRSQNLFETASFSATDKDRTKQYQVEAKRVEFQNKFSSIDQYLENLEMKSEAGAFDTFYIPRIAQLTQRSNQFNLRTKRYTEADITTIAESSEFIGLYFTLADKFGDHGLISVIILQKQQNQTLFIDTWIMSCRVLKRGVENFVLNQIVKTGKESGFQKIIGEYIPTPKNGLVKDLYKELGFQNLKDNLWGLQINSYKEQNCFIKLNKTQKLKTCYGS